MKKKYLVLLFSLVLCALAQSFRPLNGTTAYHQFYRRQMTALSDSLTKLQAMTVAADLSSEQSRTALLNALHACRLQMKACDIWLRYLEPLAQKQINGPLPVEWETEVFEKFEKPYRREGAGLLLAEEMLGAENCPKDQLRPLLDKAVAAAAVFQHDSVLARCADFDHFLYANRLHLLNLAALYTTGFECPNAERVIPELSAMMEATLSIYHVYNESFTAQAFPKEYMNAYAAAIQFVRSQPQQRDSFDHFRFIRDFVNPLYALNASLIQSLGPQSHSTLDYTLQAEARSVFDKGLYEGQSTAGVFAAVNDRRALASLDRLGQLLFFDPILSGNGERSCASCHKATQFFTDTLVQRPEQFRRGGLLPRNAPTLINASANHLAMADGAHYTLQQQTIGVLTHPAEMNCPEDEILPRVLSCKTYQSAFEALLPYTPQYKEVNLRHISSALTYYYGKFNRATASFDRAMNRLAEPEPASLRGFNLFMGKAQCATCHFVPQFNGVKPPYIGSEFEVLGTPADKEYSALSSDSGRYRIHPAPETLHAFRTGSLRNIARTAPYMHNGVFRTLEEVIDFYDFGGGAGHGLSVPNQTLSADSLHLSSAEKLDLKAFLISLNEDLVIEKAPKSLPATRDPRFAKRVVGGVY